MQAVAATSTNREERGGHDNRRDKKKYNKNGGNKYKKRLRLYYVPICIYTYMCVCEREENIIGEQLKPANMIYIYHIRRSYDI